MPFTGQQTQPAEIVDIPTLQNNLSESDGIDLEEDRIVQQATSAPSYGDVTNVAIRDWPTASASKALGDLGEESDPNFTQPWAELEPQYYPYRPILEGRHSAEQWYEGINEINQEIKDDEMKRNMTAAQWAYYYGVSMADPISVGLALATMGFGSIGKGYTLGQAAGRTAGIVAVEATAIEGILQLTDPMRTWDESMFSIVAAAGTGGFIGLGGQKVYNLFHNAAGKRNNADNLKEAITSQFREETNLVRVENALEQGVTLDNVTVPPPPKSLPVPAPVRMKVEGIDEVVEKTITINKDGTIEGIATRIEGETNTVVEGIEYELLIPETNFRPEYRVTAWEAQDLIDEIEDGAAIIGEEGAKAQTMARQELGLLQEAMDDLEIKLGNKKPPIETSDPYKSVSVEEEAAYLDAKIRAAQKEVKSLSPPAPARMAVEVEDALPPVSFYVDEAPTDFDYVSKVMDDYYDTRDIGNIVTNLSDETPLFNPFKPIYVNRVMMSPQTELMYNGVAPTFSRFGDTLGSTNIYKRGDYNGTRYNGPTLRETIKQAERRAFVSMSDNSAAAQAKLSKKGVKITTDQVAKQAGRAAMKGSNPDDYAPEVWDVGQKFRSQLDNWKERGLEQGVFTEEALKDMDDYVTRMWDMDTVSRKPALFRSVISTWAKGKEKFADMTTEQIDQLVVDIKDSLNRVNAGEAHPMVFHVSKGKKVSGHAKARRIDANDLDLKDFLVTDVRVLLDRYVRGVGADIILREQYGKNNLMDIKGFDLPMPRSYYEQGVREFDVALKKLEPKVDEGSVFAKRKYKKLQDKRARTIKAAKSLLRHAMQRPEMTKYPGMSNAAANVQGVTASAGLGGVVESAFPDGGNNVTQHGMMNLLGSLPEFFKALPQVFSRNVASSRRAMYWRDMDVAVDNLLSNRMMDMAGLTDDTRYGGKHAAYSGLEIARRSFRWFLADRWNTGAKLMAGTAAERAAFRDIRKMATGKKLTKHRQAKMHRIGVTDDVATRVYNNLEEHGKTDGLINFEKWDAETQQDLRRLLFRESEFQVVAPDKGEMPEIFDNFVGRLFMQYKQFMLTHTLKQLVPASQRLAKGDMAVLSGMATIGSLAIFSRYVKDVTKSFDKDSGFDIDAVNRDWGSKTPMDLAAIAVDSGAMLSFLPMALSATDNFFNNELGEAIGMTKRKKRYSPGLGIESNMAALGYAGTFAQATWAGAQAAVGQKEYTARDLNKVRRTLPMQNTFYLQWLFDWGEQSLVEEFNLPESNSKNKASMF